MQRSLSEAANYVLRQFNCFVIKVPNNSRLILEYKSVCKDNGSSRGFIPEDDSNFDVAIEAQRDFRQLEFFFDQIDSDAQKANCVSILKQIIKDSVFPQDDKLNSQGRNAQAEAFVFAVCKNAGMNPLFEEPDVTCQVKGKKFGIAVKRIKNLSKIKPRLVEGKNQINKLGLPGIIFVEVTIAVNPQNYKIVTNENEQEVRDWWTAKMRNVTNSILNDVRNEEVRGIFLHECCPVCFPEGQYLLRSMTYGISTSKNEKQKNEWRQFKGAFIKGLPNLIC
ncbi:MAG: hypothetical protein JW837_00230 [Sedimentisphaerales bacterium]|nr:hypothetical protein [Sedimentisphaerales bacterium]